MNRRKWITGCAMGLGAFSLPLAGGRFAKTPAQEAEDRQLPPLTITDVKTILTAPARIRLVVVKVETSEPGLYRLTLPEPPGGFAYASVVGDGREGDVSPLEPAEAEHAAKG